MEAFREDLKVGKEVEQTVCEWIKQKYPQAYVVVGKKSEYDIVIPEVNKTIEVKSDRKSRYTGNIVVEFFMFGKPSGLLATTADWWIIFDGERYIKISPTAITLCIFENKLRATKFTGRGDSQEKQAFLIDKDLLFSYGTELPIPVKTTIN